MVQNINQILRVNTIALYRIKNILPGIIFIPDGFSNPKPKLPDTCITETFKCDILCSNQQANSTMMLRRSELEAGKFKTGYYTESEHVCELYITVPLGITHSKQLPPKPGPAKNGYKWQNNRS